MKKYITFEKSIVDEIELTWQEPVITEKKIFENVKKSKISLPYTYVGYPWATLFDLHRLKYDKLPFQDFLDKLDLWNKVENGITVLQSHYFKNYLEPLKNMGIKYFFCVHAVKGEFIDLFYEHNILVVPIYTFPANSCFDINLINDNKQILYSFMGMVDYNYNRPTIIRNKLLQLNHPENCVVKKNDSWHFNDRVYGNHLNVIDNPEDYIDKENKREQEYRKLLFDSRFSLCPLGSGPNSIRIWESLSYGAIPVIISDDVWFPKIKNVNYQDFMIFIKEKDIDKIPEILQKINPAKEEIMREKGLHYYKIHLSLIFGYCMEYLFVPENKYNLLVPWYNCHDENRYLELLHCLKENIKNPAIKNVVLFYELMENEKMDPNILEMEKVRIVQVCAEKRRRISFNQLVTWANNNVPLEKVIISNNDIYFDDTLPLLGRLDLRKHFVALTRKNYLEYVKAGKAWKPHNASQDSWIFQAPLTRLEDDIYLGWIQSDNILASEYDKLGYQVVNPWTNVNSWHVQEEDNTGKLTGKYDYQWKREMKFVPLLSLEEIKSDFFKYELISVKSRNKKVKSNDSNIFSMLKKRKQVNNNEVQDNLLF